MKRIARGLPGAVLVLLLGACASAHQRSQDMIAKGQHGPALEALADEAREAPRDAQRRMQLVQAREQVLRKVTDQGMTALEAGRLDEARSAFSEVLALDPGHIRALEGMGAVDAGLRRARQLADARQRLDAGDVAAARAGADKLLAEHPQNAEVRRLDQDLRERANRETLLPPTLRALMQTPVSLEFRDAPIRMVMEALARSVGLNVMLDRDIRPDQRVSIFVRNVRVEDALDLLIHNHQLARKVLSENTVLVYPATPQKLAEYRDLVMKTFQLRNADAKQTVNLLRTMLKTRDLHVDERANLIVMRDTPEAVRAAELLIAAQDGPDPEVVLELEILEVSSSRMRDLGITHPTSLTGPSGTLADIRRLTSRTVGTDTGYGLRLLRTDGDTKTLANPRVRVRSRERARVHVGDRVPVISSTVIGTTGGAGATPVTTEQIQYLDVGIKIEVEPQVHADDTVAVRINLDVSSLGAQTKTNAGTTAYEVGTRNATTVLRLRDGETQALMGLIRDDDQQAGAGLPFVGELPLLDRVFGTKRTERRSRELVLLVTPRIVRGVQRPDPASTEFWSGTEGTIRLREPVIRSLPPEGAANPPAATPVPAPARPSGSAPPAAGPQTSGAGAPAPAEARVADSSPLVLSWRRQTAADGEWTLELQASGDAAVQGLTLNLAYDPKLLTVLAVEDGGFFDRVGGQAVFTPRTHPEQGDIFATVGASAGDSARGPGTLLRVRGRHRGAAGAAPALTLKSVVGVDAQLRRLRVDMPAPGELSALR